MRVVCIPTVGETPGAELAGKTVLVIDVLRATSTIITALANGADSVVPVETVAQARQMAGASDLLAGERQCRKIPGFHLGNSPLEFVPDTVKGRRIVMTTTNGTRGIHKASKAAVVIAASMLNARACAEAAVLFKRDVVLLCAGTKDAFALEDGLCAGLIVKEMRNLGTEDIQFDDLSIAMEGAYLAYEDRLAEILSRSDSGVRLTRLGSADDVAYCAQRHTISILPILQDGNMKGAAPKIL